MRGQSAFRGPARRGPVGRQPRVGRPRTAAASGAGRVQPLCGGCSRLRRWGATCAPPTPTIARGWGAARSRKLFPGVAARAWGLQGARLPRPRYRAEPRGGARAATPGAAATGSCAPGGRAGPRHGGGAQPRARARALELGLPRPLLRPPPRLHLLRPVDLRLLLLDRRPRAVMGPGPTRGGGRGLSWEET